MDDPTRLPKEQLQANGSTLIPHRTPSPTSFHSEQYFFSRVPSQGLYLTRSKSFPYYLLAIALLLFQTSSSGIRFAPTNIRGSSVLPVLLSFACHCGLSFLSLSLSLRRYIFWIASKPYPL